MGGEGRQCTQERGVAQTIDPRLPETEPSPDVLVPTEGLSRTHDKSRLWNVPEPFVALNFFLIQSEQGLRPSGARIRDPGLIWFPQLGSTLLVLGGI